MPRQALAKILLVDDQPNNLLAVQDILEDVPADLLTASSGNEALSLVMQHDVALVLLDVQMPGMDGLEVATLMRQVNQCKHIPIIFVTAHDGNPETTFKGYEAGAVDYIQKPIAEKVLESKVNVFLELFRQKRQIERSNEELEERVKQRTEELQIALAASEAASRAKTEFLANMSHEIRTPMTAILGYSDILLNEEESVTPAQRRESLSTIHRNGEYLIGIINDILDLSKIESGKMVIEQIDCSPREILQEVVTLMQVRAKAKGLRIAFETDGPLPRSIQSDPTRLRQILINIVGNAIKFTDSGKVRLVARMLNAESESPSFQIDVVDTGIGLTDEQLDKLFQPFVQADTSTTRKFGGTGLGLTISRRLAEALGGGIRVKSVLGEGSTFTINVSTGPLEGVPMGDSSSEARSLGHDNKEKVKTRLDCRVLLAEDGPDNQRLIAFILKQAGAETTVAENGQIATELALAARDEENPFDVILMDMQMPVMDGYTATVKLREAGYTGPIIALTAHAMSGDRDRCLEVGCDDYATKPINRANLISMVTKYASQKINKELVDV